MPYWYLILQVSNFVFSPSFFFFLDQSQSRVQQKTKTIPNAFVTQLKIVTVVQGSVRYGVLWRSHEL